MRGRFAPTPSGQMHIGNARTALLSWLQIRRAGGTLILRMEDIDRPRSRPELADLIFRDLHWLGLDWDEGPDSGGPHAPYTQSQRESLYQETINRLIASGALYPCYCSRAEIMAVASAPHGLDAEGPIYPGTCRNLTPEQGRARADQGRLPSLRFAMPDQTWAFTDLTAGPQSFSPPAGGDFVIRRADGVYAYQLAVVIDDALMEVSHVLRGSDLLDSTPRQLALFKALGYSAPVYAHLPLLFGPDATRLAKRHGSVTLAAMRAAGVSPEKVLGYLAFVSGLIDRPEPVRAVDLLPDFDLRRVPNRPVTISTTLLQDLGHP